MAYDHQLALKIIDSTIRMHGLDDNRPPLLHHYTSLTAALSILQEKDIRLCHAEYLNDLSEIRGATELITNTIRRHASMNKNVGSIERFCDAVEAAFDSSSRLYEAFVFCMSEGDSQNKPGSAQDVLDSWRVYGGNGKGICLSYYSKDFADIPGIDFEGMRGGSRLSKVIYSSMLQEKIVLYIVDEGYRLQSSNSQDAILATVAALVFMLPVFKDEAFRLEKEWRFIFLPEVSDPITSLRGFYVRGDLMVPYYPMEDKKNKVKHAPMPAEIMLGPSLHQDLNLKSLDYIRSGAAVKSSQIPYRG